MTFTAPYSRTMRFDPHRGIILTNPHSKMHRIGAKLEAVYRKIAKFVKKLWNQISFWKKKPSFQLNEPRIQQMRKIAKLFGVRNQQPAPADARGVRVAPLPEELPPRVLPLGPQTEPLQELENLLEEASKVLVSGEGCFFDTEIQPKIAEKQRSCLQQLDQIKETVNLIIDGKNALLPLQEKFSLMKYSLITVAIPQTIRALLNAAGDEKTTRKIVEATLKTNYAAMRTDDKISVEQYTQLLYLIEPTLNWTFSPNNWLFQSSDPMELHNLQKDSLVFIGTLKKLLDKDAFQGPLEEIKKQITGTLEEDVKAFLELNTKPIASLLTSRIAALIEHLPFKDTFDELIKATLAQTEGWITANERRQEMVDRTLEAKNDVSLSATDIKTVDKQREAQKHLNLVSQEGGEDAFLNQAFHLTFASHEACHPLVKEILNEVDPEKIQHNEEDFCRKTAAKWANLLFPTEETRLLNGEIRKVNGLNRTLEIIALPPNLEKLKGVGMQLFREVLNTGDFNNRECFEKYFFDVVKSIIVGQMQNKIQEALADGFLKITHLLSDKDTLDRLSAKLLFPALIEKTFESWARAIMETKIAMITPHFHKILQEGNTEENQNELFTALWPLMNKNQKDFDMAKAGIDADIRFREILRPLVEEITVKLNDVLKSETRETPIRKKEVTAALQQYFKVPKVKAQPVYGELTLNALVSIGNLGGVGKTAVNRGGDTISESCTAALSEFREDYTLAVTKTVRAAAPTLLNPVEVADLLFSPEPTAEEKEAERQETNAALETVIENFSKLTHDYLVSSIKSRILGRIVTTFISLPTSAELENVISDVYHRLLSHPALNQSIILQVVDIANRGLDKSAEKIEALQLKPRDVAFIRS